MRAPHRGSDHCRNAGRDLPLVILKVGTLDDPSLFGTPQMAIFTCDKQPFRMIPDGMPAFERLPPR